ncbi:MAG: methionyl-tRNA formyltransferase [Planctomycetota bacterium]
MRIIFWGTPEYAVASLEALAQAGSEVAAVVTQPDRPAGRSLALQFSPVKTAALKLGLAPADILQPETTRDPAFHAALAARPADLYCVVAYGNLLTRKLLRLPRRMVLNAHGSLLPRWRGASPIQAALLHGDLETGVTLMRMVRALDAGPMLLSRHRPITPEDTAQTVHDDLARLSAELFVAGVQGLERGELRETPQDDGAATYCRKITRADAAFAWTEPAVNIQRKVRAFTPWPGVKATFCATPPGKTEARRHVVSLLEVAVLAAPAPAGGASGVGDARGASAAEVPGQVHVSADRSRLTVSCGGAGALAILRVKPEGKAALPAVEWLRGVRGDLATTGD